MDHLLNLVAVFSVALILVVLFSVRRAHIRVEYSVSWLLAGGVLFALSQFPPLLRYLAALFHLDSPPLTLLMIVLLTFLIIFFRFSIILSNLKDSNVAMMQRVAILEYQLRTLNEEQAKQTWPS